jgi:hypothetical protein
MHGTLAIGDWAMIQKASLRLVGCCSGYAVIAETGELGK